VLNTGTEAGKPFDLLAEEPLQKNSRGDWTPSELFIAEVRCWEAELRRRIDVD
jgi:hypothetical protein